MTRFDRASNYRAELINQKQKNRNERVAQQSNGERTARSRKNSEKNVPLKSTNAASSSNAKMQETNNNEQLKNTEGKELPKKGNQNRRKNTRKKGEICNVFERAFFYKIFLNAFIFFLLDLTVFCRQSSKTASTRQL